MLAWQVLELIGTEGMSSDESDTPLTPGHKCTRRTRLPWISPIVTEAWVKIDQLYSRMTSTGQPIVGNVFRHRLHDHVKDSKRAAVRGLPRNLYNPIFLACLPAPRLRWLQPAPDIDLTSWQIKDDRDEHSRT